MNKQFKHKKTGEVLEYNNGLVGYYSGVRDRIHIHLPVDIVEDSNDWEEIIKKEYEIQSFIGVGTLNIYKLKEDGTYRSDTPETGVASLPTVLCNSLMKIYSVKRISDGEIFTLKDIINNNQTIESISLIDDKIRVYPQNSFYHLENVRKEKPLFKTADGHVVFNKKHPLLYWAHKRNYNTGVVPENSLTKPDTIDYIYFVNKYKRDEYVLFNKPLLSLNDLLCMEHARGIPVYAKDSEVFKIIQTVAYEKLKL